ncbi:MAG: SDR family NAD(P)-dependent oxidoreductase [Methylococcales bacterium]|nr:SDR family NAD(P)-dependent oxidoreductase [Methylococcales bacterium]
MPFVMRTFLVTGASSGIGRAMAKKLLAMGFRVIGVSRDCSQFKQTHVNFSTFTLDLSNLKQLPIRMTELLQTQSQLDGVVFAAGAGQFGSLEEFSYAQIEQLMTLNFTSNALLTRALLPSLKRKRHADLIYIGSEAALKGSRKGAIYCASKFALRGFTQALREECAKSQVRVALINPGMVNTPFFDTLNFEPGSDASQYITAEDVADTLHYILSSNPNIVLDEINLSPLNKVIKFKP